MKMTGNPSRRAALVTTIALALLPGRAAFAQQATAQEADNLQDYLALIPGLSLEGSTRGVSRITLRGIITGGVASTVGVYVDEVPFGSSSGLANGAILAGDFDTFDIARLEVLRGPQGTLYGASSLGGVLKFVTNPPSSEGFEAKGKAGIESVKGGDLGYSATSLINVPLSDKIAIRVSGFYRSDDGFKARRPTISRPLRRRSSRFMGIWSCRSTTPNSPTSNIEVTAALWTGILGSGISSRRPAMAPSNRISRRTWLSGLPRS